MVYLGMEPCCALCLGTVGSSADEESSEPEEDEVPDTILTAFHKRRGLCQKLMRELHARKREQSDHSEDIFNKPIHMYVGNTNQGSPELALGMSMDGETTPHHLTGRAHDNYNFKETPIRDPEQEVLEDARWVHECRVLGYNPDAPGSTKAFISGPGHCKANCTFHIDKAGNDPNDLGADQYATYHKCHANTVAEPVFPFHEACYRVLTRRLGYKHPKDINKDALYSVMLECRDQVTFDACTLDLDVGNAEANNFWCGDMGSEVCIQEHLIVLGLMNSNSIFCAVPIWIPT
jgi:hypothetical protein